VPLSRVGGGEGHAGTDGTRASGVGPAAPRALVDTEGLALRDVARGLDEPVVRVRRRVPGPDDVREELTAYFTAATTRH
jgi:hypothetical protein